MKLCNSCNELKPLSDFSKGVRVTYCKVCKNIQTKQWRLLNLHRIKEYNAIHNRENYINNKELKISTAKEWNIKNPNRRKEIVRKNNSKYPERRTAACNKRRAQKMKATPRWLTEKHWDIIKQIYAKSREYQLATNILCNVDHIIPLKHKDVCGLHVPWNLQILTKLDNNKKKNNFNGTYENNVV